MADRVKEEVMCVSDHELDQLVVMPNHSSVITESRKIDSNAVLRYYAWHLYDRLIAQSCSVDNLYHDVRHIDQCLDSCPG